MFICKATKHTVSLTVNYRLFAHSDVSYRFNRKNDNVLLEYFINLYNHQENNSRPNNYRYRESSGSATIK